MLLGIFQTQSTEVVVFGHSAVPTWLRASERVSEEVSERRREGGSEARFKRFGRSAAGFVENCIGWELGCGRTLFSSGFGEIEKEIGTGDNERGGQQRGRAKAATANDRVRNQGEGVTTR